MNKLAALCVVLSACIPTVDQDIIVDNQDLRVQIVNDTALADDTVIILQQEVKLIEFDSKGIPMIFATPMNVGANYEFLNLPLWVQEALVAHELGHLALGHLDQVPAFDRSWYAQIWETASPFERDADFFAAENVGFDNVVAALWHCGKICHKVGATECSEEVKFRIEMLQNKYCF